MNDQQAEPKGVKMDTITVGYEECLSVSDYGGDFDKCAAAVEDAKQELVRKLKQIFTEETLTERPWEIKLIRFVEFDSTNPGHAAAYFYYEVEVKTDALITLIIELMDDST